VLRRALTDWPSADTPLCVDLETTALEPHRGRIVTVGVAWPGHAWCFVTHHAQRHLPAPILQVLVRRLSRHRLIGHNLKFDLRWLTTHTGMDISHAYHLDTMYVAHLLEENEPKSLKWQAQHHLGVPPWADQDFTDLYHAPIDPLVTYNLKDCEYTYALAMRQYRQLQAEPALARLLRDLVMPAAREYLRMECAGMDMDGPALEAALEQMIEEQRRCEKPLLDFAAGVGLDTTRYNFNPNAKWFKAFMHSLCDGEVYAYTAKGNPSWSRTVLQQVRRERSDAVLVGTLLEHRRAEKGGQFLRSWQKAAVTSQRGRMRVMPTFKLAAARTGRTSCEEPNVQQVPRDKRLRNIFVAPPGHVLAELDYSQIELRVAAWVFREPTMLQAFRDGRDLHAETAQKISGKPRQDITTDERFHAKAANFGFIYGMGARTFRQYAADQYDLLLTEEESQDIRHAFFSLYSELQAAHGRIRRLAHRDGYVRSPLGRLRRLPGLRSWDDDAVAMAERQAVNFPVQSTASDLLLLSLPPVADVASRHGCTLRATIHDSLIVTGTRRHLEQTVTEAAWIMTHPDLSAFGISELPMPLAVDVSIGRCWSDPEPLAKLQVRSG
jgi:DNA polymerase-1